MWRRILLLTIAMATAGPAAAQAIRISEVMASPNQDQGGQQAGEFVELVNIGDEPIDLTGWRIADAQSTDILLPFRDGGSMVLEPSAFAVILDPDNEGQYAIPTDSVLLRPGNAAIGNSLSVSDTVTILNTIGETVDTHTPPMAARRGKSFERVDFAAADEPQSWQLCTDATGTTIGRPTSPPRPERPRESPQPDLEGVIVINEIMFRPKPDAPEWVEVHNLADLAVTMAGWTISDTRDQPVVIPVGTIPAKGYAVLTRNAADFRAEHPETPTASLVVELPLPTLADAGDTITLRAGAEATLDRTIYGSLLPDRGQSLERRDAAADSERMDNWLLSVALTGSTPGDENSVKHETGPVPLVQAIPNPFDPNAGGVELRFEAEVSARVTLRVLDEGGEVVRTLLDNTRNAGRQKVRWDGKNVSGEPVPDGVYTVLLLTVADGQPRAASIALTAARSRAPSGTDSEE